MGTALKANNPGSQYFRIEIVEVIAKQGETLLDGVICARIEFDLSHTLKFAQQFGDALEHLQDPCRVLREFRQYIAPGGLSVACIPNVSHWSLFMACLRAGGTMHTSAF